MSNELKVTGGEWFSKREGFSTVYVFSRIGGGLVQEVAACGPTNNGPDQQEANARLIAASKKLYEALDACASYMEQLRASGDAGFWDWKACDEYSNAIAALAAARGDAQ